MSGTSTPKEKMTAYQRWEMASFDEATPDEVVRRQQVQAEENAKTVSAILQQVRQEAYDEGLKIGYQDGVLKARAELEQERAAFLSLTSSFQQALAMEDVNVAESVLTLALEVAKAMLKTKIQADPQVIVPVVLDAMHYLPQVKQPARLLVHHDDAKILRKHLGDELKEQGWQLVEEASLERGGCLVETAENQIDASNSVRWKRIVQGLSRYEDWHKVPLADSDA